MERMKSLMTTLHWRRIELSWYQYQHRLVIALLLALLTHLSVVLLGQWTLSLFSTPSDQSRTLTLSLQPSSEEGLHTSEEIAPDTLNEVAVSSKAQAPRSEPASERTREPASEPTREPRIEPARTQNTSSNTIEHQTTQQPLSNEANSNTDNEDVALKQIANKPDREPPNPTLQNAVRQTGNVNDAPLLDYLTRSTVNLPLLTVPLLQPMLQPIMQKEQHADVRDPPEKPISIDIAELELKSIQKNIEPLLSNKSLANVLSPDTPSAQPQHVKWQEGGQQYSAKIRHTQSPSDMETDTITVEVSTALDGKKLTTSLQYRQLAFSNFAQFVHQWDKYVSMHDDELNGRFHSNSSFLVSADRRVHPVFHDHVTIGSRRVEFDGPRRVKMTDIFKGGLETNVRRIKMPHPKLLFEQDALANKHTVLLKQSGRLIFTADGHYLWQPFGQVQPMQKFRLGQQSTYFIAAPKAHVYVSGEINGSVAVYAQKDIFIEGDLRYQSRQPLAQGGDFLGLISNRNITIAKQKYIVNKDLHIDAALYANNRIRVTNLYRKGTGMLSIYGSVSSRSVTATEPRYATKIEFDPRLEHIRPPGFPVTDRYEAVANEQAWQVEEAMYIEDSEELQDGVDEPSAEEI